MFDLIEPMKSIREIPIQVSQGTSRKRAYRRTPQTEFALPLGSHSTKWDDWVCCGKPSEQADDRLLTRRCIQRYRVFT
jgi:hypothetical protein